VNEQREHSDVIDYAAPVRRHSEVQGAIVRAAFGIALAIVSSILTWKLYRSYRVPTYNRLGIFSSPEEVAALLSAVGANILGLIVGGVGWARSRRVRPNWGYRLCAFANTINWLGLIASIATFILG
jgi:hypothetical protein